VEQERLGGVAFPAPVFSERLKFFRSYRPGLDQARPLAVSQRRHYRFGCGARIYLRRQLNDS
jgi:hypothetical protein